MDNVAAAAQKVLELNDQGSFTIPAHDIYPHQWLWDSCFIAIGLRHIDVHRARIELQSTLRGQWRNGMIPHMILMNHKKPTKHEYIWQSERSPFSPDHVGTSGITQPPLLAEAVWQVGNKLTKTEQKSFFSRMLPALIQHHEWLYRERNPAKDGLVVILHPWESGMDNSPALIKALRLHHHPLWIKAVSVLQLEYLAQLTRLDFKRNLRLAERTKTLDELHLYSLQRRMARQQYSAKKILRSAQFAVQDVGFNSILIRSNQRIIQIAEILKYDLPNQLLGAMRQTVRSLQMLRDPQSGLYFSRDFITKQLVRVPTIASLFPLYSGGIEQTEAEVLRNALASKSLFGSAHPVPSVSVTDPDYDSQRYWQGATWMNTNWFIIEGLRNYGYNQEATTLTNQSLELVKNSDMHEYFDSQNGNPLGASNFSWTAALALDMLSPPKQ